MQEPSPIFTLPLFPLHHVLFPFIPLQLHVFEERYREMIDHCLETNRPFGVVLIQEGEEVGESATPHNVGCLARILGVQRLDDGRMYLVAAGEQRFRLLDYIEGDKPYLVGQVELLEEELASEDNESTLETKAASTRVLFLTYLTILAEKTNLELSEVDLPEDALQLSFCIAAIAEFSPLEKQKLLETTDATSRFELEAVLLQAQIEEWKRQAIEEHSENSENEQRYIIARSLDPEREQWKKYLDQSRN